MKLSKEKLAFSTNNEESSGIILERSVCTFSELVRLSKGM